MEEIYKRALALVLSAAEGNNIREDADKLYQDYLNLGAKYKRGQEVWVFDSDYMFIRAEVTRVAYQSVGGVTWYQLYEKTGRNVGRWPEDKVFGSKRELWEHLAGVLDKNTEGSDETL